MDFKVDLHVENILKIQRIKIKISFNVRGEVEQEEDGSNYIHYSLIKELILEVPINYYVHIHDYELLLVVFDFHF